MTERTRERVPATAYTAVVLLYLATLLYYNAGAAGRKAGFVIFVATGLLVGYSLKTLKDIYANRFVDLLRFDRISYWLLGLASGVAAFLIYEIFRVVVLARPLGFQWNLPLLVALLLIIIALSEELFFRGYLQKTFEPSFGKFYSIFMVSAVVAGYKTIIHLQTLDIIQFLDVACVSFIGSTWVGYLLTKTGSLASSIICHALWDLLVYSDYHRAPDWLL